MRLPAAAFMDGNEGTDINISFAVNKHIAPAA